MTALPAPKDDFIGLDGVVHLAMGGEPPLLRAHRDAFERFAQDKAGGLEGYRNHWRVVDEVRAALAKLTDLQPPDIALTANASEAIVKVVSSFDWGPGDNVVVPALDYASGRFALGRLESQGVALRKVPSAGWGIDEQAVLAACDANTRLVYVSQVNALTGQHLDIETLSLGLGGGRTALMVDASHAIGALPVRGGQCDFLVSCCYKFLLGIHDGFLGWNRARWPNFVPAGVGWHSAETTAEGFAIKPDAQRAEFGNVGHLGAYLLRESLAYLDRYGVDAIAAHIRPLTQRMVTGMAALDLDVMTPDAPGRQAANAAFHYPDTERFVRRARERGIHVWGDNDRIRATAHLFTTRDDVDRFVELLPELLA